MATQPLRKFEWKIKNFSSWCAAANGQLILSPDLFNLTVVGHAELFPRGVSGHDDQMEVRFNGVRKEFTGDLSFFDFDEDFFWSQQFKITREDQSVLGPKFVDVVDAIRGNKDEITLLFRIRSDKDCFQYMCTTILVSEVTLKIEPNLVESLELNKLEDIFSIGYSSIRGKEMDLKMIREKEEIQLILEPKSAIENPISVKTCMSLVRRDSAFIRKEEMKYVFTTQKAWHFSKLQESEEKDAIIFLRIKITPGAFMQSHNYKMNRKEVIIVLNGQGFPEVKSLQSPVSSDQCYDADGVFNKEIMGLYRSQKFADLQLRCGNMSFPVHRNILSARSPVFDSMFSSDMKDTSSGPVDIEDLDPSTLSRLLTFLYSGRVERGLESEGAFNLIYAADKYQVPSLKKECTYFLLENLSESNVLDVLTFADKLGDDYLIDEIHHFILDNFDQLLRSEKWTGFVERESTLALKTLTQFIQKNYIGRLNISFDQ